MRRVKRTLAAVLCLFLVLGAIPADAQQFVRPVALSAPAPVAVAPAALPALALAGPLSPIAAAPALMSAAPSAVLAAPAPSAGLAVAASPAAAAIPAAPAAAPAASQALRGLAAPDAALDAGLVFDGGRSLPAAKDGEVSVPAETIPAAAAPRLEPSAPAPKPKRAPRTVDRFLRAGFAGVGASALAPLLWGAVPTAGALILFAVAVSPLLAVDVVVHAARAARAAYRRLARSAPPKAGPAPSRRKVNAIRALGFALGVALSVGTAVNQIPIVEHVHSYMDSRLPAGERVSKTELPKSFGDETARVLSRTAEGRAALDRVRGADGAPRMPVFTVVEARQRDVALSGHFFADATVATLSRSAAGRKVLDGLRDRGGVLRMPTFFVSYQKGSAAQYTPPDLVLLSVSTIEDGGVTVDKFLSDPRAQLDYLQRNQAVIAHELTHAGQARRWPVNADTWVMLTTNGSRLVSAVEAYAANRPSDAPSGLSAKDAAPDKPAAAVAAAGVVIDAAVLHREGLTVDRFVSDPRAQKDYIVGHQSELARALKPVTAPAILPAARSMPSLSILKTAPAPEAAASKPHAAFGVSFGVIQEWEYEAYITENLYTHERLASDPGIAMSSEELSSYRRGLQDFDAFLRSIDKPEIYAANFHGRSAYYVHYLAAQRAGWDAHRVEGYVLLARRDLAQKNIPAARAHLAQARAIAAEKGLPAPDLAIPNR